jgi:fucose 4-O-acetylase-like acetyltransferase
MEVSSSLKHRDNSIDVIAGILLIHMVLGHVFQFAKLTDCRFYHWMDVLFFFMPWFFFKSGMFFNKNKKVVDVMILGGKKLMSNYLI